MPLMRRPGSILFINTYLLIQLTNAFTLLAGDELVSLCRVVTMSLEDQIK